MLPGMQTTMEVKGLQTIGRQRSAITQKTRETLIQNSVTTLTYSEICVPPASVVPSLD
jgi:hypothetical protein